MACLVCLVILVTASVFSDNIVVAVGTEGENQEEGFEAAFQGECRVDAPCQQLCYDLHDGTFECGCKVGFTLMADGYSCIENGEYERLRNLNISLLEADNIKHRIFHYVNNKQEYKSKGNTKSEDNAGNEASVDPRARTLSQSNPSWDIAAYADFDPQGFDSDSEDEELYKPEVKFPLKGDIRKKADDRKNRGPVNSNEVEQDYLNDDYDISKTDLPNEEASSDIFEPVNTITMTTLPTSPQQKEDFSSCEKLKCENGGTCISTIESESFKCSCPVGWKGERCETSEIIRYPRFKSRSYLALRMIKDNGHSLRIEIEFRPELYEGIVLYLGNDRNKTKAEDSFCVLSLTNGILEFKYFGGIRIGIIRTDGAVTLNSWNRAVIFMNQRIVWLQLNDGPRQEKESKLVFPSIVKKSVVYLGGFPILSASSIENPPGFQGCIRHLAINSYFYNFRSTATEDILSGADLEECQPGVCNTMSCMNGGQCAAVKPNWGTCLCPLGFGGDHCSKNIDIVVPSFDGTAHLQFPGLASSSLTYTEILLIFMPRSQDGTLLYNGYRINGTGDYLLLSLVSGHVILKFDLGTGVNIIRSPKAITMHEWHKVLLTRTGREAILQVDSNPPEKSLSPGGYSQLSLPLNLYLGGIPVVKEVASGTEVNNSFIGCVQKLVINGKPVKLVEQALSGVNVNNCEHPCVRKPCAHGGTCVPNFDTYSCRCPAGYTGPNCQTKVVDMVTRPMFMGTSYLHYINEVILSRLRGQSLHLTLTFRALAPFGLILWAGSREIDSASDYLALGLNNGHIRLDYNLGSGPISLQCNHTRVDDGFWHEVTVVRFKQRGSVTVDDKQIVSTVSPGPLKELNIPNELFLGGLPNISHQHVGVYQTGLVGCLSNLVLDRDYHIQFLTMAVTGINIQPCISPD